MLYSITLFVLVILPYTKGDLLKNAVNKISKKANEECKIQIEDRQLVGCDIDSVNENVPSGALCTYISDGRIQSDNPVETFVCEQGYFIYLHHKSTGTANGHVISKRWFWVAAAAFVGGAILCAAFCGGGGGGGIQYVVNKPPTITCPSVDGPFYPDKGMDTVVVTWDVPIATDPEGKLDRTDLDGAPPNSKFGDGSHTILYTAIDDIGNTATCTIRFQVKVIYCYFGGSLYAEHGRAICHTPALYGNTCEFVCNTGYQLAMSSPTTKICEKSGSIGEWQPLNNFVCEKKKCSDPPAYCNGQLLCSDGNNFDSVCYPTCADGYSTDMTKNFRCNGDEWIGVDIIQPCVDVQPPELTLCPKSVHAFSDENGFAIVDWPIPEASDNSENADDCGGSSGITVSQVLGQAPRSNFEKGYHDITYTATDNNNNGGLCKFTVIVEELSCDPLVVEDQFLLVQCLNGYALGSTCEFSCFLSYELRGGMNVTCRKHPNFENKAFWDWQNGNESYCEKLTCPDLPPPTGGALACSTALGNEICTMSCSDKYQVAKGTSIEYVCNNEQIWLQGIPPNCTDRVHPANAILPGELFYYYSGDCSDSTVQESIKNNFVDVMKNLEGSDGWDNICPDYCTVEGVKVTCGPLNGRRRRSIVTRSTDKEIVVDFKVSSQWETTKNLWGNDDTLQALGDLIKLEVSNGAIDVNGTTTGSMTFGWIEFPCEIGQEPVYEADARCVGCAPGKYLNDGNCLDCNKGYFQEKEYQINCTKCPTGKSTADNGTKSEKDCKDILELILAQVLNHVHLALLDNTSLCMNLHHVCCVIH